MIFELVILILVCVCIGVIYSIVFVGFLVNVLCIRINDCECKMVIISDGFFCGNKIIDLKGIVDEVLKEILCVEIVLVV